MTTSSKKTLGQFFTTNSKYIVGDLLKVFPDKATIVDPFAGNWDLLNLIKDKHKVEAFDIDPKNKETIKKDTLLKPGDYKGKWIFTNPPYLARNKNKDKTLYDKYDTNDLYTFSHQMIIIFEKRSCLYFK